MKLAAAFVAVLLSCAALAQQPAAVFAEQCSACHTIGGGAGAGPDLKGVGERRERAWLIKFIQRPESLFAAKDATAIALRKQFADMEMPGFPDIAAAQAEALLDYINQQSGGAPVAAEPQVSLDPRKAALGKQLFMGERRLAGNGAQCMSCHTIRGVSGFGGGGLGPDLTLSYERLGKAKGLSAWLSATPTPVMAVAYKKNPLTRDEVAAVTAFLHEASTAGAPHDRHGRLKFIAIAGGCTLLGFVAIGSLWRRRLRS